MTLSTATLTWEAHNQLRLLRLACPAPNRSTGVHATHAGDAAGVGGTGAAGGAAGAEADYDAEAAAAAAAARLLTATHLSSWNGPSSAANYVDDGLRHVVTIRYAPPTLEVYLDYELVMHTEVWLRPRSEAGGEDGPLSLPVVPAGGDAASARANVTAPALRILDEQGLAQLGFAAGRSEVGLEQYEIHEWWFKRNVDGFHGEERLSRRDEKVV